ncbi:MAG: hypothetical protein HC880_19700 [Bacteroidia bacterium]|nr:hypothetical protein [Bacteroidia bacterium]
MNIEATKHKIIQLLDDIRSQALLQQLLTVLEQSLKDKDIKADPLAFARYDTPTSISLEHLKREQSGRMKIFRNSFK